MTNGSRSYEQRVRLMASGLCERHFRVLPVRAWEKIPALNNWPTAATDDPSVLARWLAEDAGFNIGLACGPQPNGLNIVVIDVDPKNGGFETLADLVEEIGELPSTAIHLTPSGGVHYFFDSPVPIRNSRRLGPGVDVRGEGGQVVLPPSRRRSETGEVLPYTAERGMGLWKHAVAVMPEALVARCVPAVRPMPPVVVPEWVRDQIPDLRHDEMTPAEWVRENQDWAWWLTDRGWQHLGGDRWKRPDKHDEGHSAVLHDGGPLVVWSTEIPPSLERLGHLTSDNSLSFSLFDFIAGYDFGGDRAAAAAWVRSQLMPRSDAALVRGPVDLFDEEPDDDGLIDWTTIDEAHQPVIDGLAYPGRWTQVVAAPKQGKSTLLVAASVAVAQGQEPFDGSIQDPVEVLYLDMEMGRMDLRERLEECGVADPSTLTHWHARDLPLRLDHVEGAGWLLSTVDRLGIKLLVIDGLNGTIEGAEKDDTPWRDLYKFTIHPLKGRGVAILTADNLGKDQTLGPRGSSVKMDKADAVIVLHREDGGIKLTTTHRRTAAFPKEAHYRVHGVEDTDVVAFNRAGGGVPAGTHEMVATLDRLGVPLDAGRPAAARMLREAGLTATNDVLSAAIKYRKRNQL